MNSTTYRPQKTWVIARLQTILTFLQVVGWKFHFLKMTDEFLTVEEEN